ncbi:MAG TPA: hypothetical protein VK386_02575 [Acidimicrobiales bacterium]|nr:hypothetical protein [Acidimicrobiales bacterium]
MTLGDRTLHFQGKGTDLGALQQKIEDDLKSDGFTVQTSAPSSQGAVLQAKKGGFLRGVVDADRALSIMISGDSNDFTVRVGIGKWLEHLGVAALETLLVSDLFLVVDVAETAWNFEVEEKVIKQIETSVG